MIYERIDVSPVYVHLVWYFVFTIYLNAIVFGMYTIWTDLKSDGGDFVMALLFSIWCALAYAFWRMTEGL